jgi:ABC-type transporter Mla maintaining outer membrane lipid asymmetry permease subunit MlaE
VLYVTYDFNYNWPETIFILEELWLILCGALRQIGFEKLSFGALIGLQFYLSLGAFEVLMKLSEKLLLL